MSNLLVVEPTTLIRDWLRTELERPNLWAGGWPATSDAETGTVLHPIASAMEGPVTTWSYQIDHWAHRDAGAAPTAAAMAGATVTFLATTPYPTEIGATPDAHVHYGGLVEGSVSMFPAPPAPDDPDMYGHTLLCDLVTITTPRPTD